uniref:Endoplasmic reticulum-Golgi intermediate compartment protein n=1 Tax=Myotis myotis TaxID=51298 RepID=A0A7J7XF78_MYOMY|nr:endoplasmic reticulum-golgi intermediate compartment 1 [Myotis myotis]
MPFDFRRFDIYRKVPKDLTQPTYTGAIISVCCCLFILFLFLSELTGFITTEVVNELYVDDPDKDSGGKIDVSLNISLPNLHCDPLASHDYILKIVPTVYEDKSGKQRYSYQYTVANKEYVAYSHTGRIIPAIWFRYDLSPITVKYTERRQPLYRFITTICAIIGGTFTVAGILDSCIFTASEAWKKIQLGKMH